MPSDISPIAERYEEVHDTFERTNDSSGSKELPPINTHSQVVDFNLGMLMARPLFPPPPPDDPPPPSSLYPTTVTAPSSSVLPDADVDPSASQYPGAYWHTAALTSPTPVFAALPPTALAGLASLSSVSAPPAFHRPPPTPCACNAARDIPCGSLTTLEASPMLLLALCAYTARLAPPAVPTRVAADLWYESASALLSSALRRTVVQPDAVQTLLFLALRDHGRARESLAWRGVGAAIRIAVELGLDGGGSTSESASEARLDVNEETWKRCLWGVASMLDLFLSIQFNRAPACAEALRPLPPSPFPLSALGTVGAGVNAGLPSPTSSPTSTTSVQPTSILLSASTDNTQATQASECADNTAAAELAAHTRALVRIVARVHFCVALGYGTVVPSPSGSTTPATALRAELAAWHRGLPQRFRVALGGERVPRAVLEVHMLYQVAVGMLARGSSSANSNPTSGAASRLTGVGGSTVNSASDIDAETDDVASTFNVLLDKYRPSLPLASPPIVWLVFAAARAGLQRAAAAKSSMSSSGVSSSSGTARALQTQLYLLNCREALASMGGTWELARRCARTLEHLMEGDGGPSRPRSDAGKRKRADREGDVGADERRRGRGWEREWREATSRGEFCVDAAV
ncbi:Nitrogen assimilation transcriptional factor nira [Mycena sanguinolenta]|uniref:Nitrogen assimilation transcriptional factor nira n=1 Tax=Mycena sanguinolenta TaxID=230812 RepID=A0A8H7CZA2_9AGAR|nr:Nitrogen assimilation transcriptional factor nira [Mycena sanguinolenta]